MGTKLGQPDSVDMLGHPERDPLEKGRGFRVGTMIGAP